MITDIYSKRLEKKKNINNVYEYEVIPYKLRIQVIYIVRDAFGNLQFWKIIRDKLCREYGVESLVNHYIETYQDECESFLKEIDEVNKFLDIVELIFDIIQNKMDPTIKRLNYTLDDNPDGLRILPEDAIFELNHRFKENNLGYEFIEGKIIRMDRKFTHNEIVRPALNLLFEEEFKSANDEFLTAHKYYKEGCSKENPNEDFKNAIINCNKAFESTMKIICEKNKEIVTTYNIKHTANDLINDLIEANIIPNHLSNSFHGIKNILKGLRSSLESGLPVIRNKVGHGKGTEEEWVSEEFVTYAINLVATNIVLLINIYKNL
ncbi:STM4504/CBY_0614 family protein [Clostridium perfringens]|uniref:STM4504/CBY_0614 family protein n=1 Tax=Clostridium perfringens TaxID=1502 RepID=UPI002246E0EE|nr:hypothetical protein [Clostridium perfringens]MCX0403863.1 hypothetical protein [Clostridium perfringens]